MIAENHHDKRNRTCGWAWVQMIGCGPDEPGQYGRGTARQTVPQAELQALVQFIVFNIENDI